MRFVNDPPAHIQTGVVFQVDSLDAFRDAYEKKGQPRRIYTYGALEFRSASLARLSWGNGVLFYSELDGAVINTTTAQSGEIAVGTLVSGSASVRVNHQVLELRPSGSMLLLPGDMAIQALRSSCQFLMRVPVSDAMMFRLTCRSARSREAIPLRMPQALSDDLLQLFKFISAEFDRLAGSDQTPQVCALGHALIERVSSYLEPMVLWHGLEQENLVEICLCASRFIEERLASPPSTKELAHAANCSVRTLHRAFESVGDTTPRDFQIRRRLNHGRALLFAAPGRPDLTQIAKACGFTSSRGFGSAYRAEFGMTPADDMKRFRQALDDLGQPASSSAL